MLKIGDEVVVTVKDTVRKATIVNRQGEEVIVAIGKGENEERLRFSSMEVLRLERCDSKKAEEFYKNNFDQLFEETNQALSELLPLEKIEKIAGEYSLISPVWGVHISATIISCKGIGRISEQPGWAVSYESVRFGNCGAEDLYEVVEVGEFRSNEMAAEAFIRCLFERKLQNYSENLSF